MQPLPHPRCPPLRPRALVLGLLRTDDDALGAALHALAATPELLEAAARVVVVDRGAAPAAPVVEAALLPAGLVHTVRAPAADRATALAAALREAVTEPGAEAVLLLDDVAVSDTDALLEAARRAQASTASDVVGLTASTAPRPAPATWWGAVLPLDAVRAVGFTAPEAGDLALAELVLRAEAAGFRPDVVRAPAPLPAAAPVEALLLALVHAPTGMRSRVLAAGLARDLLDLLAFRTDVVAERHRRIRTLLRGPDAPPVREPVLRGARAGLPADAVRLRVRLLLAWPGLRRAYRLGAVERSSAEAWQRRLAPLQVAAEPTRGARGTALRRPARLRLRAWSTSRRGTSAA
ncbi:hypothetical protein GCM10025783_23690 [Amnibacterium soli]|uniref:Glycosyltransferase 2-like domain-containing protein n=1 Tax=Amnibacterium soli TaxID=1282736 RepID=A0ABP8Z9W1_9MICO